MFKLDVFEQHLKKDNSHYERFLKSSLHGLVELLRSRGPKTVALIAVEMKKVSADKWKKYTNVRKYLLQCFPELTMQLAQSSGAGLGASIPGYSPGKYERCKDDDNHWHEMILQQKGNSCGPACVLIVKMAWHPNAKDKLREPQVRGIVALYEFGKAHQGVSSIGPEAVGLHNWKNAGSNREPLIKTLHSQPFAVPSAKAVSGLAPAAMLEELRKCTPKTPAIVGWIWSAGGGHWTVCAGPTKDASRLIILDPWEGVQYIQNTLADFQSYQGGSGTMDLSDPTVTRVGK